MTTPELRLGYGRAELVLAPLPGRPDSWRLTASWYGKLSADFEAEYIETAEVIEFTDRLIAGMDEGEPFTARLTSGRNNPCTCMPSPSRTRSASRPSSRRTGTIPRPS